MSIVAGDRIAQMLLFPCLKSKTAPICSPGDLGGSEKKIFWQTIINNDRPQLTSHVNDIEIEGLVGNGTDIFIISQES